MKPLDESCGNDVSCIAEIDGIAFVDALIELGAQRGGKFIGLVSGKDQLLVAVQSNTHIHHQGSAVPHRLR